MTLTDHKLLETMLVHLLNTRAPSGAPWIRITVPGVGVFRREDAERILARVRGETFLDGRKPWYKFW